MWFSQLGDEHGSVLLPLLVVLAVTVTLIVLLLAHGNTGDLQQQERDKRRANTSHGEHTRLREQTSTQTQTSLASTSQHDTSSSSRNTSPKCALAKVVGVSALAPQTTSQELLAVLLGLLLLNPLVLLPVGRRLKCDTANVQQKSNDIGQGESRKSSERSSRDRVDC